ncbi:MAG: DUF192 domain-containing protein [Candidatus Woesearchaeota archaeon]
MLKYNDKVIARKIVYCDSIIRKGSGLMFKSKSAVSDTAWWFRFKKPRRISVTMMMVFFPIDILFLDENNTIIELKGNLRPFTNYACKKKVNSFVELEDGSIKKYSLKHGSKLRF